MSYPLGRIKRTDYRDHSFLAAAIAPSIPPGQTHRRWFVPAAWDQGQTSECVAFSDLLLLTAGPVRNKLVTAADADEFYAACQAIDGFDGPHDGTTVRAAMQVMQARGYITEYRWAYSPLTAATWILTKGPMVFGTDWLDSMFEPVTFDGQSFINFDPTSPIAGGHAYCVFGVNVTKPCPDGSIGAFEMQNSWGREWGDNGRAWLSFKAAAALLAENGEAATPTEILHK